VLLVVVRGRTVHAVHVSTAGPGFVTPRGRFSVYRRERLSWSAVYDVWMPYALYFSGGYAIHGYGSVPAYPASHGCVRVPLSEAALVYALTPLRAPVIVR
jgi:lipoprotein-anchoring transpeptidase ErfK/SrfK